MISANGGVNLYIGNNDYAGGLFVGSTQEFGAFGTSSKYEDLMAGVAAKTGKKMGYREVDAYFAELARRWIAANPGKAARLTLRKFLYLVSGWETGHNRSLYCERRALPVIRHLPLGWGGLLSLCLAGLALRERGNRRSPGFSDATQVVLLLSGCYALSFLPFFITGQYRMPLVPWLCLGAAAAVVGAWSFRGESRRLGLALCLLAAGLVLTHVNWLGFQPNWAKWHTDEGMAWDARQEPQKAEACYRKAVAASGQTGMAWMQLGLQATDRKAYQQALECYQQALHTGVPEMHRLYGNIATAYYYAGALKDAILWYEKATANAVEMPEILANYGNALLSLHQYDRALEQFERALSHARRPMPHIALRAGILSWKKGDRTKASRYFNLAEKLRPELRSQIEAAQKADSGI